MTQTAFGLRVKTLREQFGITQMELALRSESSAGYIGEIETGSKNPTLKKMVAIADALGVSLSELLKDTVGQIENSETINMLLLSVSGLNEEQIKDLIDIAHRLAKYRLA